MAIAAIASQHSSVFWGDRLLTLDKTVSFRDDPKFKAATRTTDSSTGENQYASPDGVSWRYNTLIWAARQAMLIEGDFVECGVYRGDMSWVITEMIDLPSRGRTIYLYDTFSGFSDKYSSSEDYPDAPQFFDFANASYGQQGLYEEVVDRFKGKAYVKVIRGVVPDALVGTAPAKVAFLHLDLNSPGPERAALAHLYDRISPGGVIVFDDYGWSIFRKQKEAADQFMAERGQTILELPTGQGLAVKTG
ncbi:MULTISPECIES: TylF/MycF/NovP-related O-methyltransferase [unclassified Bradyrhizobium]|uniref:TylF/MycF/NovP-related O-methyltransferase n=1 Tax=unclassified Bradyrhizobium TaxID=2631580 RepID=UPI002915C780|nr:MULTISPECIES: TylF/MycF/NovP-related O-methyltransferase [unclassified Bradyrhizobium]